MRHRSRSLRRLSHRWCAMAHEPGPPNVEELALPELLLHGSTLGADETPALDLVQTVREILESTRLAAGDAPAALVSVPLLGLLVHQLEVSAELVRRGA